jgi:hypothetical protein
MTISSVLLSKGLPLVLATFFLYLAARGISTGKIVIIGRWGGGTFIRSEDPLMYWLGVLLNTCIGIGLLLAALGFVEWGH